MNNNVVSLTDERKKFVVATSPSAISTRWKNEKYTWQDFCDKLRVPVRSKETMKEYDSLPKTAQGNLKNVGGFVGGMLKDGLRKKGNVEKRTLLTLDVDNADDKLFDDMKKLYDGVNICMYTTRSDRPNNHRYRIVFKLDRPLNPDEYEAVGRKMAERIGIEYFDETTFQAERLMYWGSCSSDQNYDFFSSEGVDLDTQEILDSYDEFGNNKDAWKDCSLWATTSSATALEIDRAIKKQVDPTEKSGVIGAFCRAFTIPEAISEFLPDIYVPVDDNCNRYTYVKGHTSGGLVLYKDGVFAYAHQNTDPCQGRLCNAWDLVRIHLFGDSEKESTTKMKELVLSKDKVKRLFAKEREVKAKEAFDGMICKVEVDKDFASKLSVDKQGNYEPTTHNIRLIMRNDEMLARAFKFDAFAHRIIIDKPPIWRMNNINSSEVWDDVDDACLVNYFEDMYGIEGSSAVSKINRVFTEEVNRRGFHPVKDYLNKAKGVWDGVKRAETIFIDFLGAEDNRYNRVVTRKMLLASVKRIFDAGCKFDNICILAGGQGIGKTTLLQRLASGWFTNSLPRNVSDKDCLYQIQGKWIVEMGELTSLKTSDLDAFKNFLTKTVDSFRPAYGKRSIDMKRQCVFFGTSNEVNFLRDSSGNRRFWIIPCHRVRNIPMGNRVYTTFTPDFVEQIWAEVMNWDMSEDLVLPLDLVDEALEREERYSSGVSEAEALRAYLNTPVPSKWYSWGMSQRKNWYENLDNENTIQVSGDKPRQYISIMELKVECRMLKDLFGTTYKTDYEAMMARLSDEWVYTGRIQDCGRMFGRQRVYERISKGDK